jgi:hypothetical protein
MISNANGLVLLSYTVSAHGSRVRVPVQLRADPYAWSYLNLADFSSKGPVHSDLRIKPDIICPVCVPGSVILFPGSVILFPGSVILFPGSVILFPGSVILFPGSVILFPGSVNFSQVLSSFFRVL